MVDMSLISIYDIPCASFTHAQDLDLISRPYSMVCGTLYPHMELMDSLLVTLLRVRPSLPFPCRFDGESTTGCCSLPFGPDGQELPVFSGVGAVCPEGLMPSVPILPSLLI